MKQHNPSVDVDPHVVKQSNQEIFFMSSSCLMDSLQAFEVYEDTLQLPSTTTKLALESIFGYQINDNLIGDSTTLMLCYQETTPYFMKLLAQREFNAMCLLNNLPPHNNIIPITDLLVVCGKHVAIMPILPATIEGIHTFSSSKSLIFWQQMKSALKVFHSQSLSHNDIKPSNICVTSTGDFVVLDLGSAAKFGSNIEHVAGCLGRTQS